MRGGRGGGFLMSLLVNLGLNVGWTAPAWVMLVLHYVADVTIWLFWGTLIFWAVVIVIMTLALILASKQGTVPIESHKRNVNPYSSKGYGTSGSSQSSSEVNDLMDL